MTEIRNKRTGQTARVPKALADTLVWTGKFGYETRSVEAEAGPVETPKTKRKYKRRDMRAEG